MPPSSGELHLVGFALLSYFAVISIALVRLGIPSERLRIAAKACTYLGLVSCLGVLAMHCALRTSWMPLSDNFDGLVWLSVLLVLFLMYIQRVHPVPGLEWFVVPVAILLLISAMVFGRLEFRKYDYVHSTWGWVHGITTFLGVVAFAVSAACGAMYVMVSRKLHRKAIPTPFFGSLERLERLTMSSVTFGFALLTVGIITGYLRTLQPGMVFPWAKVLLAAMAWLTYALVLHSPINPRFRGRKAALLSICGFALMVATVVAVQFMPGGKG